MLSGSLKRGVPLLFLIHCKVLEFVAYGERLLTQYIPLDPRLIAISISSPREASESSKWSAGLLIFTPFCPFFLFHSD